jgi:hypothetical protein
MVHLILDWQAFLAALSLWVLLAPAESLPSPVSAIAGPTTQTASWKIAISMAYAAFGWIAQEQVQRTLLGSVHNTPRYPHHAASVLLSAKCRLKYQKNIHFLQCKTHDLLPRFVSAYEDSLQIWRLFSRLPLHVLVPPCDALTD